MRITGLVYRLSHDTHLLDKDHDISTAHQAIVSIYLVGLFEPPVVDGK